MPAAVLLVACKADGCLLSCGSCYMQATAICPPSGTLSYSRCLMVDRLRSPVHVHLFACSYCFLIFPTVAATAADQLDAVHHHYERTAQVCRSCLHHDSSHDTGVPMCINHGVHSFWEHDRPAQVSVPARTASSSSADLWGGKFRGLCSTPAEPLRALYNCAQQTPGLCSHILLGRKPTCPCNSIVTQ